VDYVPPGELPAVYAGADALVLPSLYEGFGLPILEAMACGTPVVASRTASIPEVAGEAALLVEPRDALALATALERILTDQPLREAMRWRGLERAARFSWEATAAQILEILREVVREARSPLPGTGGRGR
jgi:glycosyltransferase involved in cell wall biosynthesis